MRVAVWHNLPTGGGKRALHDQVQALVSRGHHVEAWCPPTARRDYLPLETLVPEHVVPLELQQESPSHSRVRRALASARRLQRSIAALHGHCQLCAQQMSSTSFDVLLAHPCLFMRASPIGRYVAGPKLLYLQEPNRRLYEAQPRLPWVAYPPPNRYWWSPKYLAYFSADSIEVQALRWQARDELANVKAYQRVLVNSLFSKESLIRAYGIAATVCYLGVDSTQFRDLGLPRERLVLGVGYFSPAKRIDFVIRAMAEVRPKAPLVWIGDSGSKQYIDELQQLALAVGVDLEVRVEVDQPTLLQYLNRASVMAYAPRLEPFGLAPLEANSCGLPVVSVAEGGVRETICDGVNGLLVGDAPREMASAISRLLDSPRLAAELGRAGRQLVKQRWSLSEAADRLERQLTEVVAMADQPGSSDST